MPTNGNPASNAKASKRWAEIACLKQGLFKFVVKNPLFNKGTDILTVQNLLGHASIEKTQIYRYVMNKLFGIVSPLDRL